MRALHIIAGLAISASLVTQALAQVNLSAETANANGVPGNTVLALGENSPMLPALPTFRSPPARP